jgi:hypothetical protein
MCSAHCCRTACGWLLIAALPPLSFGLLLLHRLLQEQQHLAAHWPLAVPEVNEDDEDDTERIAAVVMGRQLGPAHAAAVTGNTPASAGAAASTTASLASLDCCSVSGMDAELPVEPSSSGRQGCPVFVMLPLDTVWVVEREGKKVRERLVCLFMQVCMQQLAMAEPVLVLKIPLNMVWCAGGV